MSKKVKTKIKLQVRGGQANPSPPVGPALGQHGLNIMDFCNSFNEQSKDRMGAVLPVVMTVYEDRTFDFVIKMSPMAELIKKAIGKEKGSGNPKKDKIAKLSNAQIKEIAEAKMSDLNAVDINGAMETVRGTARSMGVETEK